METPPARTGLRFWKRYGGLSSNVLALSFVSFLNDISSEIIYPLLPAFLFLSIGASPFFVGVIEGFAETAASIIKLFSGYLSDKFNTRKWPVFAGYSLAAIVRPLLAFVTTWPQVLVVRMGDRIGKGIRGAPRDALISESVPSTKLGLAFGFNRAADQLGAVLGPIVGFVLLLWLAADPNSPSGDEYQQVFLFASIPVVIGLFVIIFFVNENPVVHHTANIAPTKFSLKGVDKRFKRFLVIIAIFTLSNSTDAFLLLRAQQAGIAPTVIPLLWVVLHLSKVVCSLVGGELADRFDRKALVMIGWLVYAAVYLGFAFVDAPWQIWMLFVIYGIYFGFTEGVEKALVADMIEKEKRGTAYGLYNLAYGVTVFPASLLFGAVWSLLGPGYAFSMSAFISVAAIILLYRLDIKKDPAIQ